jgi:hypothetical protein
VFRRALASVTRRVNRGVAWKAWYRMGRTNPGRGRIEFADMNDKEGGGLRIFSRKFEQADLVYRADHDGEDAKTHQAAARYYLNEFLDDLALRRKGEGYDVSKSSYLIRVGCALLYKSKRFAFVSSQEWDRAYRVRHKEHRQAMRKARQGSGAKEASH